ncbi:hypothetical protein RUND412_001277 [Rhizina undulata]
MKLAETILNHSSVNGKYALYSRKVSKGWLWKQEFHRLISLKRFKMATEIWVHARSRGEDQKDLESTANSLMRAFNDNGLSWKTPYVFDMLTSDLKRIDARTLNLCLEAHLKNGDHMLFDQTLAQFNGKATLNFTTHYLILWGFIAMRKLGEAEAFVRQLLREGKCVSPAMLATLLGAVKDTGSLKETTRIFEWINFSGINLNVSCYNVMIELALAFGDASRAQKHLKEMEDQGLKHNQKTYGAFLIEKAKSKDWKGVVETLNQMQEEGLKITTPIFNHLLHIRSMQEGLAEAEAFFNFADVIGVSHDIISFNIMLHATALSKDEQAMEEWLNYMKEKGYSPDVVTFNTLFGYLRKTINDPALLRRVYEAVYQFDASLVNQRTKNMLLDSMQKDAQKYASLPSKHDAWNEEYHSIIQAQMEDARNEEYRSIIKAQMRDAWNEENHPTIQAQMEDAIRQGRPHQAIAEFMGILASGSTASPKIARLAVQACLKIPENERDLSLKLLRIAQERRIRVNRAVYEITIESIEQSVPDSTQPVADAMNQLKAAYTFLESNILPISHHVCSTTARILLDYGNATGAIYVMREVLKSPWARKAPWGIEAFTVMLRAYTVLWDLQGIEWVVNSLGNFQVLPDLQFYFYLKLAKRQAKSMDDQFFFRELRRRCEKIEEGLKAAAVPRAVKIVEAMIDTRRTLWQ